MTHMVFAHAEIDPAKPLTPEVKEKFSWIFEQQIFELKIGSIEIAASAEQLQLIADKINEELPDNKKRKGVA